MAQDTLAGDDATVVPRNLTGERILLTILFGLILYLIAAVLAFVVLFELAYSLITKNPPSDRVKRFANRLVRYGFEICQYLTYNTSRAPFPFEDLPGEE